MGLIQKRATILLCSVAIAALSGSAIARPVHHHRQHAAEATQTAKQAALRSSDPKELGGADYYMYYSDSSAAAVTKDGSRRHGRRARTARDPRLATAANARFISAQSHSNSAYGGFSNNDLVIEARKYIGTNPTGRASQWCGAFMDLVLKRTGHPGGGNLALDYAHYGKRISGPEVGAIAVMGRRGGGHVGVVSGIDPNGNPIIISGNHNHTTAESVYPRGRIAAYVVPGS
jgi:uncharacterized protein (TIGR02594 family)